MSPTKIPAAKTMEESDGSDESKMDRMMLLLEKLGIRLDKIETERSVGSPVPVPPMRAESLFAGPRNQGHGLTMSSPDAKPMQHRGSGMVRSFVHAMQHNAIDGLKRVRFPEIRDMKIAIQPFDRKGHTRDLKRRLPNWVFVSCGNYRTPSKHPAEFGVRR
ncbi:unnamed protein product [Albugo candida]|uniref:Uncharacterized protein n=1 Tax=Albugo candida TaxID=65357 RepID=A0A024FUD0_9STRA|nr:unnamed protein product [Albugo candida]|eukprot:CCI10740.1 unnamed protein product [Albugo candida]